MSLNIFKRKLDPVNSHPDAQNMLEPEVPWINQGSNPYLQSGINSLGNALGQQQAGNAALLGQMGAGQTHATIQAAQAAVNHMRYRVIIECVANGFTVTCGQEIYVAEDIDALANVVRVALVTAKLTNHLTT